VRRTVIEWVVTLAVAAAVVLAVEVEVAQPFRVPTSSMEPTLQCARPGVGCTATLNDRVIVAKIVYRFRNPRRGEIAVFHAPAAAKRLCSEGGTYLKRVIGLPGDRLSERDGVRPRLRDQVVAAARRRRVLRDGRQPARLLRLAHLGPRRTFRVHRTRRRDVLAADALDGSLRSPASSANASEAALR
jgi:signal peptidase I